MATRKRGDKFPLWLHPRGQWCKKVGGRFFYFGTDREAALKEYVRVREDLEAGRPRPPAETAGAAGLSVADLVNHFLTAKRQRVDSGELSALSWSEYFGMSEQVVETFGRRRAVATLRPGDFGKLRAAAAKRLGHAALSKFITMTRTLFRFGHEAELTDAPVRYGSQFDRPTRRVMRLDRARRRSKLVPAADIWKLLGKADPQMRGIILLGINAGFGQMDCATLERRALAVRPGWLDSPRPKSGVARRVPLWPETRTALAEVERVRPAPADPADAGLVFLTGLGNRLCRFIDRGEGRPGHRQDTVYPKFARLCRRAGVDAPGGPYVLRHTFRTVGDEARDQPAIDLIMGHADGSMAGHYRQAIGDDRLLAVVNHVRAWLLAGLPACRFLSHTRHGPRDRGD